MLTVTGNPWKDKTIDGYSQISLLLRSSLIKVYTVCNSIAIATFYKSQVSVILNSLAMDLFTLYDMYPQ